MRLDSRVWRSWSQGHQPGKSNAGRVPRARCRTAGFTLLEVLVASAILSLLLAALYGVFSRTLASKRFAEERATRARAARLVLLRIGQDLQAAFPPLSGRFHFTSETHRTEAFPEDSLAFLSLAQASLGGADPAGDLYEIAYALVPDPDSLSQRTLVRRVTLDLAVRDAAIARQPPDEAYPLLSQVRGLRFRFFDGRHWREEWGQDDTQGTLPQAVEVVLYLVASGPATLRRGEPHEEVVTFSTVIDLPVARPLVGGRPLASVPGVGDSCRMSCG